MYKCYCDGGSIFEALIYTDFGAQDRTIWAEQHILSKNIFIPSIVIVVGGLELQ